MIGYSCGMIGFPLRLLARENYERLTAASVWIKLVLSPERNASYRQARFLCCTVESMPLDANAVSGMVVGLIYCC